MPALDPIFRPTDIQSPCDKAEVVVPSDTPDTGEFSAVSRALYVGTAGDLRVVMRDDSEVTLVGVQAGSLLPIRAKRVAITGTTADNIVSFS